MSDALYPLTFEPVFRDYVWGGRNLEVLFGRVIPPGVIAESWDISAHPSSPTQVARGPLRGLTLPEVTKRLGQDLVGRRAWARTRDRFPLLVKLLDANRDLSVQVHPDDAYAASHEGGELGKTEMWYILHAEPGAEIIYGLCPGATPERLREAQQEGRVEEILHRTRVRSGDAVYVPSGAIHALLAGIVAAEIQENSDTTYRVYDWGRLGADGQPRPLHVDKAIDVIDWGLVQPNVAAPEVLQTREGRRVERLVASPHFSVERVLLDEGAAYEGACSGETLEIWGTVEGRAVLAPPAGEAWAEGPVRLAAVSWALLPAALGPFRITPEGPCTLLRAYIPQG